MTQEEKSLLLKDLCARLPYGTIVSVTDGTIKYEAYIESVSYKYIQVSPVSDSVFTPYTFYKISEIKPYLRPMSSMTEEEENEWNGLNIDPLLEAVGEQHTRIEDLMLRAKSQYKPLDWLNAHHFDYRGLIPKGLTLEAPEGMYNIK